MRSIRLDDYPSGNPGYNLKDCRAAVSKALAIFEEYRVPYLLGATPLLMDGSDIQFLNAHVKTGKVVMHGFNHAFGYPHWDRITDIWPAGGEFHDMTEAGILKDYRYGNNLLSYVHRYDMEHFIPPFNCHTQAALNVLSKVGVRYWHGCDEQWNAYGYADMEYHGMTPVISEYKKTYDYSHLVIRHLDNPSQITLHWMFDKDHKGWEDCYHALCQEIVRRG